MIIKYTKLTAVVIIYLISHLLGADLSALSVTLVSTGIQINYGLNSHLIELYSSNLDILIFNNVETVNIGNIFGNLRLNRLLPETLSIADDEFFLTMISSFVSLALLSVGLVMKAPNAGAFLTISILIFVVMITFQIMGLMRIQTGIGERQKYIDHLSKFNIFLGIGTMFASIADGTKFVISLMALLLGNTIYSSSQSLTQSQADGSDFNDNLFEIFGVSGIIVPLFSFLGSFILEIGANKGIGENKSNDAYEKATLVPVGIMFILIAFIPNILVGLIGVEM